MTDNLLIALGFVLFILFLFAPTLIATLTGRKVQVRTRTSSFVAEPFKTKKQRQKEDEQDKIVNELNEFCRIARYAKPYKKIDNPFGINASAFDMWTTKFELELPDTNGRPMLTDSASSIVKKGNIEKAILGYRNLKRQKDLKNINVEEYNQEILKLYNGCI